MMPKLLASYVLFPFVGRKNMPDANARTQNAQYLDVADDQSTARELQRVLSLSSPSFYRCALRLLGNGLTQRMRCRRRCWPPTNICTNSGDSRRCPLG